VTDRFAGGEGRLPRSQEPWLPADRADGAASRTGLLRAKCLGLLLQEKSQGAFGQPCGGSVDDLLHRVEVDIQTGAVVAESTAGDDFPPVGGEGADFLKEGGGKFTMRHDKSFLVLVATAREKVLCPL
jgi:xanthine/CO dehydrogenase XdhC/CoxF family maturation factor